MYSVWLLPCKKIDIDNDERQMKEEMSPHKKTVPLFLFLDSHMHLYPSVNFHTTERIFKMKLGRLVTKCTNI